MWQVTDAVLYLAFLSSAGYAGASVMYNLPAPPFIRVPYTVAPFEVGDQIPHAVDSH